jgi:outer membrane immunogenic protein
MPRADLPAPAHDPIVEDHPDEPLYDEPMPRGPSKPRPRPHTAGAPLYEPPHVPALETDAPPITIPRWSGFYIGLTGGGGGMSREVQVDCVDLGATITVPSLYIPRDCHYASARGLRTQTFAPEAAGLTTGASLGFNMQLGSLVTGLEADFAVSSVSGTGRTAMHVSADDENATVTHELNWLSTFRGRIGYAYGSWLLYATGGLAVGEADMSYAMTVPRFGDYASVTHTETKVGWTMGAGAEYSFGMFSIRGEVLHFDLGEEVLSAKGYFAGGGRSATTLKPEFETRGNIGRVGVSFHLD